MIEKKLTYIGFKAMDMGFDAHMTLHYTGRTSEVQRDYLQTIIDEIEIPHVIGVKRTGITFFGKHNLTPVVTVIVPEPLLVIKEHLDKVWPSPSEYKWNPHITLNMDSPEIHIPELIKLTDLGLY